MEACWIRRIGFSKLAARWGGSQQQKMR